MAPSSRSEGCHELHRPPSSASPAHEADPQGGPPEQLTLAPTIQAAHRANAGRLRALAARAIEANGMSLAQLAAETGYDERQIGRALKGDGGAHMPWPVLAAILHLDRLRILATGIAALLGCDLVERKPDLAAENRQLRSALLAVRAEIDALLGGAP